MWNISELLNKLNIDLVHYLPEGYALQGEMFYRALLKAYNDYCSQ